MRTATYLRRAERVDVLLLLEGTFPYVSGGVSSWVNQLMRGLPEITFGGIFLGSRRADYGEPKYALPENLVHLECHFLHEAPAAPDRQPAAQPGDEAAFARRDALHARLRAARARGGADETLAALLDDLLPAMRDGGPLDVQAFLHSEASWRRITQEFRTRCSDPSFVDYFWTVRIMHAPLWQLAAIAEEAPAAGALHAISTGYAGFLGALLARRQRRPFVLTEHGIYTKERKIDLFQAQWVRDNRGVFERRGGEIAYFRDLWIRFFEALGRIAYSAADPIVALYEANRRRQIADGAPPARTQVVPNGVDVARLARLREGRPAQPPPVACLIGRVVPIKDVATFIRALRTVVHRVPHAQGWIAGPEDEDPAYAQECRQLAEGLGLADRVRFLGFQKIDDLLPQVGVVVLSSISEALPLVILEAFAAGVPCVTTDVGACRELIEGQDAEDRALGAAGAVVRIADPSALGHEIAALLTDPARWQRAAAAGIARVEQRYTQARMFARYRAIYARALAPETV
ncbi:MAG: GT4 family glycosyltransferase PelF [Burkholderiaceae bacterium]|nr:GT4 family glycosyltransferase PelF [Burkholderiaceae bacterium]